jgi:hypothetical protein
MQDDPTLPQINISKIAVGGGLAGAFVAGGSMLIFLVGIPLVRYMFPVAILGGVVIAMIRHYTRHETSSTSRILSLPR